VVTLSREAKLGKYLYNVDVADLRMESKDPSKAAPCTGAGVLSGAKNQLKARKKTEDGVVGALAGTSLKPTKESVVHGPVTEDHVHGRGLAIMRKLRERHGPAMDGASGRRILAAGDQTEPTQSMAEVTKTALVADQAGKGKAKLLTEGRSHGVMDQATAQYDLLTSAMSTMAAGTGISHGTVNMMQDAQLAESMHVPSMDPLEFQKAVAMEQLQESGVDLSKLSDEDLQKALEDAVQDTEETVGEGTGNGGLLRMIKDRGYENAEEIARKIESGEAPNEWFALTGGSLQDAKRLVWEWEQMGNQ
jgi:hypothetical protein